MMQSFAGTAGFVIMGVVCLYALIRGGRPEKIAAVIIAVAWLASSLLQDRLNILSPQWGVAALDVVLIFVFLGMAVYWRRGWLIFACAT
jgi:asparagine N-glycosylation enzyme membrane subunit Stt3